MQKAFEFQAFALPTADGRFEGFVIELPVHDGKPAALGRRFDVAERFSTAVQAKREAELLIPEIQQDESGVHFGLESRRIGDYRIDAWPLFDVIERRWQPAMQVKRMTMPGRGAIQEFSDKAIFTNTRMPGREQAINFALSYGEGLVMRQISGLAI